jgi:hypothetical protein
MNNNNGIIRKVEKVIKSEIKEDEELRKGLEYINEIIKENSINERKSLKSNLERKLLDNHKTFFQEYKNIYNVFFFFF